MKSKYKIELSEDAENDLENSYRYYEEKSKQAANNFYKSIDNSLVSIQSNPYSNQEIHEDTRRFVIKKFPFAIYYQIKDVLIKVIAIFNTYRDPEMIEKRF